MEMAGAICNSSKAWDLDRAGLAVAGDTEAIRARAKVEIEAIVAIAATAWTAATAAAGHRETWGSNTAA